MFALKDEHIPKMPPMLLETKKIIGNIKLTHLSQQDTLGQYYVFCTWYR